MRHGYRPQLLFWLMIMFAGAGCSSKPAAPTPGRSASTTAKSSTASNLTSAPDDRDEGGSLAQQLWSLYASWSSSGKWDVKELQAGLQPLRNKLPELKVTTGDQALRWNSLELPGLTPALDGTERRFAAFRFRSPLSQPADLHWAYAVPQNTGNWYIVPLDGQMRGFSSFQQAWNLKIPALTLPPGNTVIFQELTGGQILPGIDYVIWYVPGKGSSDEFHTALRLSPPGTHQRGSSRENLAQILGIDLQEQTFPDSPAGLSQVYDLAVRMIAKSGDSPGTLHSALRSVRIQIPEIKLTDGESPVWNTISPDVDFTFHTVRFTCPPGQPADLQWCHTVEHDAVEWGFMPLSGSALAIPYQVSRRYFFQVDCPLGLPGRKRNLTVFQNIPGGHFLPGEEYLLWFRPRRALLPDLDLALRLTPQKTLPENADARAIGKLMGLDIPAIPAPDRVAATLERVQQVVRDLRTESGDINRLLAFAAPALPVLSTSDASAIWTKIDLDTIDGTAVAFRLPLIEGPQRTVLAVAAQNSATYWGWIDGKKNIVEMPGAKIQLNVKLEGLELPDKNVLQVSEMANWEPDNGDSPIVMFSPRTREPVTVYVSARSEPSTSTQRSPDLETALRVLRVRFQGFADPGGLFARHDGKVLGVVSQPDQNRLLSVATDGTFRIWDLSRQTEVSRFHELDSPPRVMAASRDGQRLAVLFAERGQIRVFDTRSGQVLSELALPVSDRTLRLALSPNGRFLLAVSQRDWTDQTDKLIRWNLDRPERLPQIHAENSDVRLVFGTWHPAGDAVLLSGTTSDIPANSPAGSWIVGVIRVVDPETWEIRAENREINSSWSQIALSNDGRRLATINQSGQIMIWNYPDLKLVGAIYSTQLASPLTLNRDGSRLLARTPDGRLILWNVESGLPIQSWPASAEFAATITFSPDGNSVILGGNDGGLRQLEISEPPVSATDDLIPAKLQNSLDMQLIRVVAGSFQMGTPPSQVWPADSHAFDNERPQHTVRITRSFYLGAHEVTVGQFRRFVEATGYKTTAETSGRGGTHLLADSQYRNNPTLNWRNPGFPQSDNHPVVHVSWDDAVAFCQWLSDLEGHTYRLPREAEWEYACRAGSAMRWSACDTVLGLEKFANVADLEARKHYGGYEHALNASDGYVFSAPVGSFLPNSIGLYDMHGNVWEWCQDYWDAVYYAYTPDIDPQGARNGSGHCQRGGGFLNRPSDSRSAHRDMGPTDQVQSSLGFRVLREISE